MTTAAELSVEQRRAYVRALKRGPATDPDLAREQERRQVAAWDAARAAAAVLRERFGAARVVVFGSLARGDFSYGSDIDLAAWNIAPSKYFEAVSSLLDLGVDLDRGAGGFRMDVVAPEVAPERLRREIEREGVDI